MPGKKIKEFYRPAMFGFPTHTSQQGHHRRYKAAKTSVLPGFCGIEHGCGIGGTPAIWPPL